MDPLSPIRFHGTTAHLAEAIKRDGLLPRNGCGPHLCGDANRARGYAVRASCLALAEADPTCPLAHLPPALLVIVTAPPDALIRDPACAGDLWLANPNAANLRLETFSARPWIRNPAEAKRFAELMLRARHLEDQWGSKRRRNAEGLPPLVEQDEPPASRRDRGPRYGNAAPAITRPDLGQPLT